jgi:dihydroflavonol-4-reductase
VERGKRVRVLVRPPGRVRELDVEIVSGDLRDRDSVRAAARGCDSVFHAAADYRLWAKHPNELYQSNVDGTRNVLDAAWSAGAGRVVYTSTVGCIGIPRGGVGDEASPVSLGEMTGHYKRSKFLAERVALNHAAQGRPVVIVNPTAPVGSHDVKPTPTGRIIVDFLKGRMPAYVDTGLNIVDARDVAEGHLLAAGKGKPGERYILGGENLTLAAILGKLAALTGKKAPSTEIPYALAYAAALFSTGWARLTGTEPRAPIEGVRMARKKMWVTSAKAEQHLGFRARPAEAALASAVEWFLAEGYC